VHGDHLRIAARLMSWLKLPFASCSCHSLCMIFSIKLWPDWSELFDIANDPEETQNQADTYPDRVTSLLKRLNEYAYETVRACLAVLRAGSHWGRIDRRRRALALQLHCSYTMNMSTLRFEWDERKAAANERKHGVSFEEARTVFFDERARLMDDPDHSEDEERFILLGLSGSLRLLLVCHCYRRDANVIRIISARKATARESKSYP
jgi:uncharacterized DUF497 family protein